MEVLSSFCASADSATICYRICIGCLVTVGGLQGEVDLTQSYGAEAGQVMVHLIQLLGSKRGLHAITESLVG